MSISILLIRNYLKIFVVVFNVYFPFLSLLGVLAKIKWWLRRKASVYNVGDLGLIPGSGSSLEKETATHSSTRA